MKWPQRIFDCHSHWATQKGHVFQTPEDLANQKKVFRTEGRHCTEDEMAAYFRRHNARVILHLYITAGMPIEKVREYNDYTFDFARRNSDVVFGHWLNLDPRRQEESLGEYRRALDAGAGFVGMAMAGHGIGIAASDPRWDPFYEAAIEAKQPVMLFAGLTGIGQGMRGGKGRPLFFTSSKLDGALSLYLRARFESRQGLGRTSTFRGLDPDSRLFLTATGEGFRITPYGEPGQHRFLCRPFLETYRKVFRYADVPGATALSVRHTVVARLYDRGADEEQVGLVLGISDRRAVRDLFPRARPTMTSLVAELI